ncbi:MAG: glycosyl hydrolase [Betaproteobacteria bacterium]|nr:glycosyl hydrolase [Betaproteobacteria bacterium]
MSRALAFTMVRSTRLLVDSARRALLDPTTAAIWRPSLARTRPQVWFERACSDRESTMTPSHSPRPMISIAHLLARVLGCLVIGLGTPLWAQTPAATSFLTNPVFVAPLANKAPLLAAAAAGARLVAAGDFGTVLISDDAGKSWRQGKTPTRATLTSLYFLDPKKGWAAGHGGVMIGTVDGGETWTRLADLGAGVVPFALRFENAAQGLVVGAFGFAATTQDGGKTWKELRVSTGEFADQHLYAIFTGPGKRLWVTAEGGNLYYSDDGTVSFKALKLPYKGSIWGGLALPENTVLVWGMRGNILKSADGGRTWSAAASGTDQALTAGLVRGAEIVLVGLGGAVVKSQDGGTSFQAHTRPERPAHTALLQAQGSLISFTLAGIGGEIK